MDYDTLLEVIKRRRSIRKYTDKKVPDEMILKILEAGRWAPSAANSQPWEWIVVRDKLRLNDLTQILRQYQLDLRQRIPDIPIWDIDYLRKLSACIIVGGDERVKGAWSKARAEELFLVSLATAIQNVMLAATSLGLGSVWFSGAGGMNQQKDIRSLFKIPENIRIIACVPLGYPKNPYPTRYRRKLNSNVHWDKFDRAKMRTDAEMEPKALYKLGTKKPK